MMLNVEAEVIAYLEAETGARTGATASGMDGEFITVERVGGARDAFADYPLLAIQAWADTDLAACELMERAAQAMEAFRFRGRIYGAEIASIYRFPDPSGLKRRYQATCNIITR